MKALLRGTDIVGLPVVTLGGDDLADVRDVVFDAEWPVYAVPGFIVLVQKRDREWALVARLDEGYLVEDRSGIGICSLAGP